MGAGGVIQQNDAVHRAVNNTAILLALPTNCQTLVQSINAKALGDWTESDYAFMVGMLMAARHC